MRAEEVVAMIQVLEIVNMVPNKRGPVELQLVEMARQALDRAKRSTAVGL